MFRKTLTVVTVLVLRTTGVHALRNKPAGSSNTLGTPAVANSAGDAEVRKPSVDRRQYRHITLAENGLKVLAVEDKRAAKAGFAVAVEAGSFYDPVAFPGLAHFTEHLLFLGTKKYPDESSFDNFMSLHDGSNNAYTEQERTVFFNEVNHAGFDEGMDRFAQFFIEPLFKKDLVGRELNAVNSEHEKNKPDQNRRMWQIMRGTARPDSVLSRFYTGTVDSLHHGDDKAVAALREYHAANYCGPRMNLVMVANLSLDVQLDAARRHFGGVPRGSCAVARDFSKQQPAPWGAANVGQLLRMGTISTPTLWMMFPLKPTLKLYKEAPMQYLQYALSYAGPRSLKSQLKRRGLINSLDLQVDETSAATVLFIMFDLTPKGAQENSTHEVADVTFSFIQLMNEAHSTDVASVGKSLQSMSQVSFDYVEAPDNVMDAVADLAASMAQYPAEDVLTASNGVIDTVNPVTVKGLLEALADPWNTNLAVATPGFNSAKANRYEQYYDVRFQQESIPLAWKKHWALGQAGDDLRVPAPLHYVPTALTLTKESSGEYPQLIEVRDEKTAAGNKSADGAALELWWKGRGEFALPKAQLRLRLSLPIGFSKDAKHEAFRRLHADLVEQVLEETTEDLRQCGLDFNVNQLGDGYQFDFGGYDQHLDDMVMTALGGLLEPQFSSAEFAHSQQKVVDDLSDTTRSAPYELAIDAMNALTTDNVFGREEVLHELRSTKETELRGYLSALQHAGLRVQLLVVGNVGKEQAKVLASKLAHRVDFAQNGLHMGGLLTRDQAQRAHALVASQPVEVRMRNPIPLDINHATVNSYQYGVPDISERVKLLLLGKMIANPVYDTLRTKKQLGYIVFGFMTEHVSVLELTILVQGSKESPDAVDADIDGVLTDFGKTLRSMSQAEFLKWKASVRSSLLQKAQNMGQEADRYWSQIANDGHCFQRKHLALEFLDTLQTAEAVEKIFQALRQGNRKVSVKLFGAGRELEVSKLKSFNNKGHSTVNATAPVMFSASSVDATQKQRLIKAGTTSYPSGGICSVSK